MPALAPSLAVGEMGVYLGDFSSFLQSIGFWTVWTSFWGVHLVLFFLSTTNANIILEISAPRYRYFERFTRWKAACRMCKITNSIS